MISTHNGVLVSNWVVLGILFKFFDVTTITEFGSTSKEFRDYAVNTCNHGLSACWTTSSILGNGHSNLWSSRILPWVPRLSGHRPSNAMFAKIFIWTCTSTVRTIWRSWSAWQFCSSYRQAFLEMDLQIYGVHGSCHGSHAFLGTVLQMQCLRRHSFFEPEQTEQ